MSSVCQIKCFNFSFVLSLTLLFVIHHIEASNRTDSEIFQASPDEDRLSKHHLALFLYITVSAILVASLLIFLLGVYVIMKKKEFQPPPPLPPSSSSVPTISSSITCTKPLRRCPECGYDVKGRRKSTPSLSSSVATLPAISVWDETKKVMPWEQGPMFTHGNKHPLDDGIYQLKYGHHRSRKIHRRSEQIRLQTAAITNDQHRLATPVNDLNINLRISTRNHHGHRHQIISGATVTPSNVLVAVPTKPAPDQSI